MATTTPHLLLGATISFADRAVHRIYWPQFFENLLPEGMALDDESSTLNTRDPNTFELLGQLGQDLPGGIVPAA